MPDRKMRVTRRELLSGTVLTAGLLLSGLAGCASGSGRAGKPSATAVPAPTIQSSILPTTASPATKPPGPPTPTPASTRPPSTSTATLPAASGSAQPTVSAAKGAFADIVLRGGKIITIDPADTIAQALAIKDGLIQAAGPVDKIDSMVGPKTQIVELQGKAVTPGLIDAHNHFQVYGLMQSSFVAFLPPDVKTIKDMQAKLADTAAKTPKGDWINAYYLTVGDVPPLRQQLDVSTPDHPVFMMQQGGHIAAVNTLALKMAGVTAATPDPDGGVIERDPSRQPTGVLYNHRAMDLVRRVIPMPSVESLQDNIISTQPVFAACGVTSFQDNNIRGADTIRTYLQTGKQKSMFLRATIFYTLEWPQDVNTALKEIEHYSDPFMRFAGFKFLIDGQLPTAYCHEPHGGVRWDMPTWEPKSFKQAVRAMHDTGLQICVHCAGDAAADLALDAFEEAMKANPRPDPRHRLEHAVLTTPQATKRIKDLGVVVSTQPQFIRVGGDAYEKQFGPERAKRIIVTREWLDAGITVALGSDSPTTPWYTPNATLAGAVTRVTITDRALGPEQRLTIKEALRAHTMGSAYAAREEKIKGSIEVGKLADLAVWQGDPYSMSEKELFNARMAMTIVGGKIVYQA